MKCVRFALWWPVLLIGVGVTWSWAGQASEPEEKTAQVPPELQPWIPWVLQDHEALACPFAFDDPSRRLCLWPTQLDLELATDRGLFRMQHLAFDSGWVGLPGNGSAWPQEVRVDGGATAVIARGGRPCVHVSPGFHRIEGTFSWSQLPETLDLDAATGLIALAVNGKTVPFPQVDATGRLWIRQAARPPKEEDALGLQVFRQYEDDRPANLITRVELEIAGKNREIVLGPILTEAFEPIEVTGDLPLQWEPGSLLRVQGRPGSFTIVIRARCADRLTQIRRPEPEPPWPENEVWTVVTHPEIRQIAVEHLAKLDPSQTLLPEAWKVYPTYLFPQGGTMELTELIRGYATAEPDQVSVRREIWLDFDGSGFTFQDHLSGAIRKQWRLETAGPTQLGHVTMDGEDRLVTRASESSRAGVELRRGTLDMTAESRIEGRTHAFPAVGWDVDAQNLEATLHLPPGWRLLTAFGVDRADDAWIAQWNLFDMLVVLLLTASIGTLWGVRTGIVGFVCLVLMYQEIGAPRWIWVSFLPAVALLRVLPQGRFASIVKIWKIASMVGLLLISFAFMVQEVRGGLFPHLSRPFSTSWRWQSHGLPLSRAATRQEVIRPASPKEMKDLDEEASYGFKQEVQALIEPSSIKKRGDWAQFQIDPQASVQTGPGVPNWEWDAARLSWNGPVDQTHNLRLWLLSPRLNAIAALLRVALLALLIILTFEVSWKKLGRMRPATGVTAVLLVFLLGFPGALRADIPPKDLLQELEARVTEPPDCAPSCADLAHASVKLTSSSFSFELVLHAAEAVAVPLPGNPDWFVRDIRQNGIRARGVIRGSDGMLWVSIPAGISQWSVSGRIRANETVALAFPLPPRSVDVDVDGWQVQGLRADGSVDRQLLFSRHSETGPTGDLPTSQSFSPFFIVERKLILGLEWEVETRLIRVSPLGSGAVVAVPLLSGESVTTPGIEVRDKTAHINIAGDSGELSWRSLLAVTARIDLSAPEDTDWNETWILDASPIWHIEAHGFPPIRNQNDQGVWQPTWFPWPGETMALDVTRPTSVPGPTMTIDRTLLEVVPGTRLVEYHLTVTLRTSRGEPLTIEIGEGAEPTQLIIDSEAKPFNFRDGGVEVSLNPGPRTVELEWRQKAGIGLLFRVAPVRLSAPGMNHDVTVSMPHNRWTLLAGGTPLGPVVLFWPYLLVLFLFCLALGRLRWAPITTAQWFLLGLGLTQVHTAVIALIFGWLLVLGLKERTGAKISDSVYNAGQLVVAGLTILALGLLLISIRQGLLGSPEMQISGYGSTRALLCWYQERTLDVLPQPWVCSVPLWVYRSAMLAWSLWLAFKLTAWLRWSWRCFARPRIWLKPQSRAKRPAPPPIPPEPQA